MAAIAPSLALLSGLLLSLAATPRDTVTAMAGSLADAEAIEFFNSISRSLPDREVLMRDVRALEEEFEISSSVEVISLSETDGVAALDLDWYLTLKPRAGTGDLQRRRERLKVEMRREGRTWRVTALQPLSFFAPR